MTNECDNCTTWECNQAQFFIEKYNEYHTKNYKRDSCLDKDKGNGEAFEGRADLLYQDQDNENEKMLVEVKTLLHGFKENNESKQKVESMQYNVDKLKSLITDIINNTCINKEYQINISIKNKLKDSYLKILSVKFKEFIENNWDNEKHFTKNIFSDEYVNLSFEKMDEKFKNITDGERILFAIPLKLTDDSGMTLKELFEIGLDYDDLVEKIFDLLKRCKNKFKGYETSKKVVLFIFKFKTGMQLLVDMENFHPGSGFNFKVLQNTFNEKLLAKQKEYDYIDEIYISYDDEMIIPLKMQE
ncbi:hypothetical protein [Desulfosporosinus shakirovi]|uniref:hypothetical protein n=1 Tax=Desulfosporosinus shakirovi TaxID=2885154 RepID=UPI001E2A1ECB|nr:hypothetical protein [Desulfosporosinus sp. SRJS8]MCB8817394.1 hypothetical protein [Desulfosporosinus sp. SRJS8]